MSLKTQPSPDRSGRWRHLSFLLTGRLPGLLAALACVVAVGACGSGGGQAPATSVVATAPATVPGTQPTAPAPAPTTTATTPHTTTAPPVSTQPPPTPAPSQTTAAPAGGATTPHTAPAAKAQQGGVALHPIKETARLVLDHKISITHYLQKGTLVGTFPGTMTLDAQLGAKGVVVSFSAQLPGGSVHGRGLAILQINGAALDPLNGTATITGGTGTFAHAYGGNLKVTGKAALDGSRAVVSLAGSVRY